MWARVGPQLGNNIDTVLVGERDHALEGLSIATGLHAGKKSPGALVRELVQRCRVVAALKRRELVPSEECGAVE